MKKRMYWLQRVMAVAVTAAMITTAVPVNALTVLAQENTTQVETTEEKAVNEEAINSSNNYELMSDVQGSSILHCWNWSYKTIEEHMKLIAECGFTAVQTSPAQQPKDYTYQGNVCSEVGYPGLSGKGNWWKLYQPVTFSVCDNGQTWLGTKAELESMCAEAEKYGIKVIVDIVANHMGNITGWQNSMSDISPQVGQYWREDMMTDSTYWHINDYKVHMSDGRMHFTQGTMGMPDLNTQDSRVQKFVYDYLDELIDCGVDGFRFDAAKHIETPDDDPSFAGNFWPTVLNEARSHYKSLGKGDLYVYGEILNTVGDNFSIDSYTKYMSVTDNSAGNHLLEAFRNNNASGGISMDYAADKSVLWAESHDTYMNESSRYASDKSIVRTWALVANKKDAASLFFVRPYYSDDTLINGQDGAERGNLGNILAPAMMGECATYVWASKEVAAINHFNNRMKDSVDNTGTAGNIVYCQRGDGVILVNFDGAGSVSAGIGGLSNGTYTDEVSGGTFTVSGGTVSGNITSEYGVAVLYKNTMANPGEAKPVQIRSSLEDKSKFYLDTLKLTISTDYADSASYVASTGESGTLKGDTKIEIGKGAAVGDAVTLKVTATSGRGTYEKTFTYYKEDLDIDQCIFFKPNSQYNWTKANAYIYAESSKVVTDTYSGWSGVPMFEYDVDADGNTIYAVQVDNIEKYNMVNFNNNVSELQTSLGSYGQLFDADKGSWSQYMEPGSGKAKVTASVDSGIIRNEKQVTFTVTNADSAVYAVDGGEAKSFTDSVTLTVGKDLAEGESTTIVITATKGDKVTEKKYTYTMGENKPDLGISQSTGTTFKDSLEVTITADNVVEASYQVDDNPAQAFTGSKTITLGESSNAGDMITVTVSGKSSNGKEAKITASYVKTGNAQSNCIYFKNTGNWGTVTAYMWNDETGKNNGAWPGVAMKVFDADQNIYGIEVAEDADYQKVIFSNSGNSQTADVVLGTMGQLYDYGTGVWSDYQVGTKPTITATLASGSIDKATEVTYTVENGEAATLKAGFEKETSFTDKVTVKVGEGLKKGETQTVLIKAINGDCVTVAAYTYEMAGEGEDPTSTPTPVISDTPSETPVPTVTDIPDETPIPTVTGEPSGTPTPVISDTPSDTPTPAISETPIPTVTDIPDETPIPTVTEAPSGTPTPVISGAPSETPTPAISETPSGTPTPVISGTPSETPTPTVADDTPTPTVAEEPEDTPTPTITMKPIEVTNTPVPTKKPEVDQKDIANQKIVMKTSLNYNGKMQLPKVSIKGLTNGVDYQVYYLGSAKNVGTYQVEIVGIGDYHGSVIKTYRVEIYKNKTYTVGNYKYKVTNATKGKGQVTVTGARKSTLTSVTMKDTVKIGGVSFKITAIGSNAFANQKKLKSVTIGSNVKKIGSKAFYKDSSLKKITIKSTQLTSLGSKAIKNIDKNAVIKVPASQKKKYKKLFKSSTGYKKTMSIK